MPTGKRLRDISGLTDNSGGTASETTVAAHSAAYVESEVENNMATLTAKINELLDALRDAGWLNQE